MNEQSPHSLSMLWFVAGGVVGAGLGLLLAPQAGKTTRAAVSSKLTGSADSVRALGDRIVARGEEAWDEVTRRVGGAATALAGHGERNPAPKTEVPSL